MEENKNEAPPAQAPRIVNIGDYMNMHEEGN